MALYREIGHIFSESEAAGALEVTTVLIAEPARYRALLASVSDREDPVGLLTLSDSCATYAGGYYGIVQEFYVVPEMRSRGVGRELIRGAREIGVERRWHRIEVTAPLDKRFARSEAFYRANGFQDSGPRLFLPLPLS